MSLKSLQDYTAYAKYAHYLPEEKRRETWQEQVDRMFGMHERKFSKEIESNEWFKEKFYKTKELVKRKRILGSQRALQFGGRFIEKNNCKLYNCAFLHIDRVRAFQETMYLLLCGCGVGFSVQSCHNRLLPEIQPRDNGDISFVIEDSIEGWSDAIGVIMASYFRQGDDEFRPYFGKVVKFDGSKIRPQGSLIDSQFIAPGPDRLLESLENIELLIEKRLEFDKKLHPIDSYDILMHSAEAVLSGGVRRSATICIFSADDEEMYKAKIGDWFETNKQRCRSNNSAAIIANQTSKEQYDKIFEYIKGFGEPAFVFLPHEDAGFNPCVEISLWPKTEDGRSGVEFCNLSTMNGKKCKTPEDFLEACEAISFLGTLQSSYTDFPYLTKESKEICDKEALLGCSITGIMDSPDIFFDEKLVRKGVNKIKEINEQTAAIIGVNPSARLTAIKPEGTTSCVLGTASGIHPHHARRYFRHVQANVDEFPLQIMQNVNPRAVEKCFWNDRDYSITFLCNVPAGSVVKNDLSALELLEKVKFLKKHWVDVGTRVERCSHPNLRHNVSNTITVFPDEWDNLQPYLWENIKMFSGVSLIASSGDKDYPQAPFCAVPSLAEFSREYGEAGLFASGLIVDGLSAFNDDLWQACNTALGIGENLAESMKEPDEPVKPKRNGYTAAQFNKKMASYSRKLEKYYQDQEVYDQWFCKKDWVRRANQFAERYFDGDVKRMTYCLKDCHNIKLWNDLEREYVDVDWSKIVEENPYFESANSMGGAACSGGKCEII